MAVLETFTDYVKLKGPFNGSNCAHTGRDQLEKHKSVLKQNGSECLLRPAATNVEKLNRAEVQL